MSILTIFRRKERFPGGWLGDEKEHLDERNFHTEEIFKSYPTPKWEEKPISQWKIYEPVRNQDSSSSCVAFSIALALGVNNLNEEGKFVVLSPRYIYSRGYYPDGGGMFYLQAFEIARKEGCTLESLMPSDNLPEEKMRVKDDTINDRWVAQIYKPSSYVFLPMDIDVWAGMVQSGKVICAGVRFNSGGFNSAEVVLDKEGQYGHAVNIIDATLWKGKKALIFQHAWRPEYGYNGRGVITEDQFKNGVLLGAYFEDLKYEPQTTNKPKIALMHFPLSPGMRSMEVVKLQIGLQWLGYFPSNQECTGYYGGITRDAVKKFQQAYGLNITGVVDINTGQKFNEVFGS